MKKIYTIALAAMIAGSVNAQNGAPLYATGSGNFPGGEWTPEKASEFNYANGEYTLEITNLTKLKISTNKGGWETFNEGALTCNYGSVPGKAVVLYRSDADILAPWTGDYTITVAGDLSTLTLSTTTPEPGAKPIYLRGGMNEWGVDDAWKLTEVKDNIYKLVLADDQSLTSGTDFKVADADWGTINYGGGDFTPVKPQTDYHIYYDGSNLSLDETCTGVIWVTLDFGGLAYLWYSNDKEAMPEWAKENANPKVSWGIIGDFNSWEGDEIMTETEDGVYTITMPEIEGEFKFRQNGFWTINRGADTNPEINLNGDYAMKQDGANFIIPNTKNVTFTLNINTNVLAVFADSLSAVTELEEDNASVKYFNLQGVKVENPVNGLYIKVQGKNAKKVLVK